MSTAKPTPEQYDAISRTAGDGNRIKWMSEAQRQQQVTLLVSNFSRQELLSWVAEAQRRRTEWTERARRYNAGQDLMDAMRGPYDFSYQIALVKRAADAAPSGEAPKDGPHNKTKKGLVTRQYTGGTGSMTVWHWGGGHEYAPDRIRKAGA